MQFQSILFDLSSCVIFIVYLFFLNRAHDKYIDSYNKETIKVTDYALEMYDFPDEIIDE